MCCGQKKVKNSHKPNICEVALSVLGNDSWLSYRTGKSIGCAWVVPINHQLINSNTFCTIHVNYVFWNVETSIFPVGNRWIKHHFINTAEKSKALELNPFVANQCIKCLSINALEYQFVYCMLWKTCFMVLWWETHKVLMEVKELKVTKILKIPWIKNMKKYILEVLWLMTESGLYHIMSWKLKCWVQIQL